MQTLIHNATLVLPDRLVENGWLLIENQRIAGLGEGNSAALQVDRKIDGQGQFLMPGLIDLHSDAIERQVEPRPEVIFDTHIALGEIDRRLASAGITTEFHAISLDDNEFGTRSVNFIHDLAHNIKVETDNLVRHEIHARLELTSQNGFETIKELIKTREVRLISLMDHTPGQGQYKSEEGFRQYIKRTVHMSDEKIDEWILMKKAQKALVPERIETVTRLAREAGLAIATHDDDTAEKIAGWPKLGVTMAEFPTTMEAATAAHKLGLVVCMGAPNVLRGKSSGGNISALETIQAGVCDALCADYYPAAMLGATFKLVAHHILSLSQAVQLVTLNPAKAVGLDGDFGSLEVGKVADIILVKATSRNPRVLRLFVDGQERLTHA